MTSAAPLQRRAVRAIVLSPETSVLLMHIQDPARVDAKFWVSPGGGVELGEDHETALRRELYEELGRENFDIGPLVYRWRHEFCWNNDRIHQAESFYIVETPRFEPELLDAEEAQYTLDFRWWPIDELATSNEVFSPRNLLDVVRRFRAFGAPANVPTERVIS